MPRIGKLVVAISAVLVIMTVLAPSASAGLIYDAGLRKVSSGDHYVIKGFRALDDAGMSYEADVQYGPNVDVLLLESDDFEAYKQGDAFSYLPMSRLNTYATGFVESGVGELVSGTEYYLVIDNSNRPAGGASPSGPEDEAQVAFEIGGGNVESIAAGSNFMTLFIIIGVVVAIAVMVVLVLLLKGMKSKGGMPGKYPATGFKICPRCGAQAPSEYTFCPKCGNRV